MANEIRRVAKQEVSSSARGERILCGRYFYSRFPIAADEIEKQAANDGKKRCRLTTWNCVSERCLSMGFWHTSAGSLRRSCTLVGGRGGGVVVAVVVTEKMEIDSKAPPDVNSETPHRVETSTNPDGFERRRKN